MNKIDYLPSIKLAVDFIEDNLQEPIGVNEVCALFDISPWQFQRLFRLYVGDSIGNYLRGRRLTEAAKLISEKPDIKLLDVAVTYGFGSQEAFSRAFKTYFEITPGQIKQFYKEIKFKHKPLLSESQLQHNLTGIQREPQIEQLPAMNLVGLMIEICSPFYEDNSYEKSVLNLWRKFNAKRDEINERVKGIGYGVIQDSHGLMSDEKLEYISCALVNENSSPPKDMTLISIPTQQYAIFEKRGLEDKTKLSIDYIYGFWLPQSGFKRAKGADIEIFDKRLSIDNHDSISRYCIPIMK